MNTSVEDTPFWFYFCDDEWNQSNELRGRFRSMPESEKDLIDNKISLALHPLYHATLDEVAEDMMEQILNVINL